MHTGIAAKPPQIAVPMGACRSPTKNKVKVERILPGLVDDFLTVYARGARRPGRVE